MLRFDAIFTPFFEVSEFQLEQVLPYFIQVMLCHLRFQTAVVDPLSVLFLKLISSWSVNILEVILFNC